MKNNNGFKASSCPEKKCYCCNPEPPTLTKQIIKNLGVQFYKMDVDQLSDQELMVKNNKKKTEPIARKAEHGQHGTGTNDGSTGRQEAEGQKVADEV